MLSFSKELFELRFKIEHNISNLLTRAAIKSLPSRCTYTKWTTTINMVANFIISTVTWKAALLTKASFMACYMKTLKHTKVVMRILTVNPSQSLLPQPTPRNSMVSDHGCTSNICFDNVGDKVKLTLYNMLLV